MFPMRAAALKQAPITLNAWGKGSSASNTFPRCFRISKIVFMRLDEAWLYFANPIELTAPVVLKTIQKRHSSQTDPDCAISLVLVSTQLMTTRFAVKKNVNQVM